ncbi:myosin heavy chain kinase C, partial [Lucilia sericata]|uniref:myosin heavy chain kinase C n=1 Tax=Lucilia sericata TaxID=13632 RepID=UPI0018A85FC9
MDLLSFLLYFLLTRHVTVWAQIHSNTITTYTSTTTITSNNSNSQNFHNNNHRQRRSTGSSSSNNIPSVSENSVLYLTPSQPSIPHFVNASFIIFCNTKQRTIATTDATAASSSSSSSPSASLSNTVQTDIETKWKDPNGVVRENTKGRVHVEKRG